MDHISALKKGIILCHFFYVLATIQGCCGPQDDQMINKTLNESNSKLRNNIESNVHRFKKLTDMDQRATTINTFEQLNRTMAVIDSEIASIKQPGKKYSGENLFAICNHIIQLQINDENRLEFEKYYLNDSIKSIKGINKYAAINTLIRLEDDISGYYLRKLQLDNWGISIESDYMQIDSITFIIPIVDYNNFRQLQPYNYTIDQVETANKILSPEAYSIHSNGKLKWIELRIHQKYNSKNDCYTFKIRQHDIFGDGAGRDYAFTRVVCIQESEENNSTITKD